MKTVGLLLIGFGTSSAALPAAFAIWAHHMYTVGPLPILLAIAPALPGVAIVLVGAILVWAAQRRPISN